MQRLFQWLIVFGVLFGSALAWRLGSEPSAADRLAAVHSSRRVDLRLESPGEELRIQKWVFVDDFETELAVFNRVFWDSRDTQSLRKLIRSSELVRGKSILEIGTGSGLISLCCLRAGADHVVATDINPSAIGNARYNAHRLGCLERFELRLVSRDDPSAYSVVEDDERFDLIISNPPWVDRKPETVEEFALYDENFALAKSLISGAKRHLKPGGRILLAYGCVDAIRTVKELAEQHGFVFRVRDQRNLDDLPAEFLPGMLIELSRS